MATSPSDFVCVACGELARKNNRRILGKRGSVSEEVTLLWVNTIQKKLGSRNVSLDVDSLIASGLAYMCRKCHYLYDKLVKAHEVSSSNRYI